MAFDKENTAHLITLRDYGISLGVNSTNKILKRFNLKKHNPIDISGPSNITKIKLSKVLFGLTLDAQDRFRIGVMYSSLTDIDTDLDQFRSQLKSMDQGLSDAIDGMTRKLSYADQIFGDVIDGAHERANITKAEWLAAKNYTGDQ